mgnify:CR=1 FL=1
MSHSLSSFPIIRFILIESLNTDYGDKYVYPLFQKTISYDANGDKGEIVVVYSGTAERAINRALAGVIPENYTKGEKTYAFKEWKLDGGVYKAEMTSIPYVRKAVPRFSVTVADRAYCTEAPMQKER